MGMLLRRNGAYKALKAEHEEMAAEPAQEAAQAVSEAPRPDYESMKRGELESACKAMGIDVKPSWNKARILQAIEEA